MYAVISQNEVDLLKASNYIHKSVIMEVIARA